MKMGKNILGDTEEGKFFPENAPILDALKREGLFGKSCEVNFVPNAKITTRELRANKGLIEVRSPNEDCGLDDICEL